LVYHDDVSVGNICVVAEVEEYSNVYEAVVVDNKVYEE
jgi:hypothetical protein